MDVILAGYNVDSEVLEELKKNSPARDDVTPETLPAAYARISRDPRSATELRRIARAEVGRARSSNQAIVYKMGHHSVAEHAVFNFDILNISRLAIETLEAQRLCSYTEKSQRYITMDEDFVIAPELASFEPKVTELIKQNFRDYRDFAAVLQEYFRSSRHARLEAEQMIEAEEAMGTKIKDKEEKIKKQLYLWANEDARYLLPLAVLGQLGFTSNARNLEKFVRDSAQDPLNENRDLGKKLFESAYAVAPSLFLFTEPNEYHRGMRKRTKDFIDKNISSRYGGTIPLYLGEGNVKLIPPGESLDNKILASFIVSNTGKPYMDAYAQVLLMPFREREAFMKEILKGMNLWDDVPREFEMADLTYELVMSASAFAQFKRHRMLTLLKTQYDPKLGYTIPTSIKESGAEARYRKCMSRNEDLFYMIFEKNPDAAAYVVTNGHNRRILVKTNLRELYKISRLREDLHAQWDIRGDVKKMTALARQVMPLAGMLLGGKHEFEKIKQKIYNSEYGLK
jgi:flavin-dependent thymidylate synthase